MGGNAKVEGWIPASLAQQRCRHTSDTSYTSHTGSHIAGGGRGSRQKTNAWNVATLIFLGGITLWRTNIWRCISYWKKVDFHYQVSFLEGFSNPICLGYNWDPLALCWLHSFSFHVGIFCSVTLKQFMLNCELLTALESPEFAGWIGIVDFEGPIDLSCNQIGKNDFE